MDEQMMERPTMEELCYTALDVAAILSSMDNKYEETVSAINRFWEEERSFLVEKYRDNKKKFITDVYDGLTYFGNKPKIDAELPQVHKDLEASGRKGELKTSVVDMADMDLFFKSVRFRILLSNDKRHDYVRIKRGKLLETYGFGKMTPERREYFLRCTYFYHLQPKKGNKNCRIEDVKNDEMITFRIYKDLEASERKVERMGLFFKRFGYQILLKGHDYKRIKRRTLLERCGVRKMTPESKESFLKCTYFYHLQPQKGNKICRIEDVKNDDMITFRIV